MRSFDYLQKLLGCYASPASEPPPFLDLMTLEDRVLYSVAPMIDASALAADAGPAPDARDLAAEVIEPPVEAAAPLPDAAEIDAAERSDSVAPATATVDVDPERTELVVVGSNVHDLDQVLAELQAQSTAERKLEVVLLDPNEDGFAQLDRALAGETKFSAIHFLTHGDDAMFRLGNTWFDATNVAAHQLQISHWADSLTADADLLFYGCDLAASVDGQALLQQVHELTGADVAASDDATGIASRGGDWDLEIQFGVIETNSPLSDTFASSWDATLATYVVTNTNDSGAGSLRQAILDANANAGQDTIEFNIAGAGPHIISFLTEMDHITDSVILDATTQSGYTNAPLIGLDGTGFTGSSAGLQIDANDSVIRGFAVFGFSDDGIELNGGSGFADNNLIELNWLGLRPDGTVTANADNGLLLIAGASNNTVRDNVLSGNGSAGLLLRDVGTTGNTIVQNLFGLDPTGTSILGNNVNGIRIDTGANHNIIGGASAALRNIISGNGVDGVMITGGGADGNQLLGNYIGLDINGTADLGNLNNGIQIEAGAKNTLIGGTAAGEGNVISGNNNIGIMVTGSGTDGTIIRGNFIGTDASGMSSLGNGDDGLQIRDFAANTIVGGTTAGARNVFGGNVDDDLDLRDSATGTIVEGNYFGVAADGVTPLAGGQYRIQILGDTHHNRIGGTAAGAGNIIANSVSHGIFVDGANSLANAFLGNAIYNSGGLGIQIVGGTEDGYGVTANDAGDADAGPNDLQNFPLLTAVASSGGTTFLRGTVNSAASTTYRIEFFESTTADASGHGEGAVYLGSTTVTTDGSGNAAFDTALAGISILAGHHVSATATADLGGGSFGGTSEFSSSATVTGGFQVQVDSTTSTSANGPSVITVGHTTSGANRLMLVGVSTDPHNATVDSVTYNGTSLTFVGAQQTSGLHTRIEIWSLVAPSLGTHNVVVNMTGTTYRGAVVGVTTFVDVNQATPILNYTGATGDSTSASVSLNSATYDLVFGVVHSHNGSAVTPGAGQTELWDAVNDQSNGGASTELGGGSITTSWTVDDGDWSVGAVSIQSVTNIGVAYKPPVVALDATNLVTNGSFESGTTGWTANSGMEISGSPGTYGTAGLADGANFNEIEAGTLSPSSTPSYIQQSISTVAGQTYVFSLQAHNRTNANVGDIGQFVVDGAVVAEFITDDSWQTFATTFTASSATTTIQIRSKGSVSGSATEPGDGSGLLVDDIRVQAADNAVVYTENAAAVAVVDAGTTIIDTDSASLTSAAVVLTDPQTGDRLLVNGSAAASGTLASGISWTRTNSQVTFSGAYSKAAYDVALQAVQFESTSNDPGAVDRHVVVSISDGQTGPYSGTVTVSVTPVNDAPVLNMGSALTFAVINEDQTAGGTIAMIVDSGGVDRITDLDGGAVEGIAITGLTSGPGTWEYSTDGVTYYNVGAVSTSSALLLRATDYLRYVGDGQNGGASDFTFRAWDQTSGTAGTKVDTTTNGGTTAFSTAQLTVTNSTTSVNDAPVLDSTASPVLNSINEDSGVPVGAVGTLVSSLVDVAGGGGNDNVSDVDTGAALGVAITAADTANGSWYYSTNGGANWNALGAVSDSSARLLAADANTRVYFQPTANYNGTLNSALTFRAWDQTSGANGGTANTSSNGGTTAFSSATDTAALTVNAVNDPPAITSNGGGATANVNVAENATTVTTVTAADTDLPAQTLSYSISGGADAALFQIDSVTGALTFASAPDYEAPADVGANNVYNVTVQVSDGAGGTDTQAIAVTVTAVNDNNPLITSNGGGATASINIAENATAVTAVVATDADLPTQTLTYSISGGADAVLFQIDSVTGALTFIAAPDYEAPADTGANNVYNVTVQVSDGAGGTDSQAIAITVTPMNDNNPVITSNSGGATAGVSIAENTTAVTTVTATDADAPAQTFTYAIVGGTDAAQFTIGASSGVLVFSAAPNFEAPVDANGDNLYQVIVQVSDGAGGVDTQTLSITVNDVAEVPTGANQTLTLLEDGMHTFVIADFGFSDQDAGDSLAAVRIDTLPAAGSLTLAGVNVSAGQVVTAAELLAGDLQFRPAADANGAGYAALNFSVRDQSGLYDVTPNTLTFDVTAVNDAPTIVGPGDQTVNEDTTTGPLAITIGDVESASGSLLVSATSSDQSLIPNANLILGGSGANRTLTFMPAADAFGGPVTIQLAVSDGTTTTFTTFQVTVNSVNDVPQLTFPALGGVEDTPLTFSGSNAIVVTDADGPASVVTVSFAFDHGALTLASTTGLAFVTGDGAADAAVTFTGTVTDINAALNGAVFTPAADFFGPVQVTFQVQDAVGAVSGGNAAIVLTAVNDAPVAVAESFEVFSGDTLLVAAPGLLANDFDVDSTALTTFLVQAPRNGSFLFNADGSFNYRPTGSFFGSDSFSYRVTDGSLTSAPIVVQIEVKPFGGGGSDGGSSGGYTPAPPTPPPAPTDSDSDTDSHSNPNTPTTAAVAPPEPELRPRQSAATRAASGDAEGGVSSKVLAAATEMVAESAALVVGPPPAGPVTRAHGAGRHELAAEDRHKSAADLDWSQLTETEVLDSLLNTLKEELKSEQEVRDLVATTAAASTAALTAGYALWALKSGHLLASLLAGMPAWRQFDPLPVVERFGKFDEDDESLVDIASRK